MYKLNFYHVSYRVNTEDKDSHIQAYISDDIYYSFYVDSLINVYL